MASPPSKVPPTGYPEFAVRRETIGRFFDPPLPRSTFHDLVNKGKIVPLKDLRGFYRLNDSLRRLGLREVPSLPQEPAKRSTEDILRLAFTMLDPVIFPAPPWLLTVEELDLRDIDQARFLATAHRDNLADLGSVAMKLEYFGGVLAAQTLLEEDAKPGGV